jgi:hypothetical protein
MATLFSYVVDHDLGFAPNPYVGYCTLVHCKFGGRGGRRNIVEMAEVGDWIMGTGGRNHDSAGNGTLIFLMRVDEIMPFEKFLRDLRFQGRRDCIDRGSGNKRALISRRYFYFGRNALTISELPSEFTTRELEKKGPGFRRDYPPTLLRRLLRWFERNFEIGMHGDPCGSRNRSFRLRRREKIASRIQKVIAAPDCSR